MQIFTHVCMDTGVGDGVIQLSYSDVFMFSRVWSNLRLGNLADSVYNCKSGEKLKKDWMEKRGLYNTLQYTLLQYNTIHLS